jgi:hypothetical protein
MNSKLLVRVIISAMEQADVALLYNHCCENIVYVIQGIMLCKTGMYGSLNIVCLIMSDENLIL